MDGPLGNSSTREGRGAFGGVVTWSTNLTALMEAPVREEGASDATVRSSGGGGPKQSLVLPAVAITCMLLLIPAAIVGKIGRNRD